ncbi:hypothetical protein ACWGST_02840 [Agromyces sp. NPDC055520]
MRRHDLAARLLAALDQGDEFALASALHRDVCLIVDSGDESGGEVLGRAPVISALHGQLARHPDASLQTVHVNGRPGLALHRLNGEVVGVLSLDGTASIETLWLSTAPLKLARWNRRRPETD